MQALFFLLFSNISKKIFDVENQIQASTYGITQEELFELSARSGNQFSLGAVDSLYMGKTQSVSLRKRHGRIMQAGSKKAERLNHRKNYRINCKVLQPISINMVLSIRWGLTAIK